ncbi:hypothetical protein [Bernardetia sp. MNP-M8]|uniref:hypothetical protein n=1 Tax=Bernardetia sp. MNP-M8 TaxID=3127470 RepID=UPI0030D35A7B
MINKKQIRLQILKSVKYGGNIYPLTEMGYSYSKIVDFINIEVDKGNVNFSEDGSITLTAQGEDEIKQLGMDLGRTTYFSLKIEPENESKILQLPKDFIFLPSQDDLPW